MRFLLFNVVVLGALFYLFTADRTDIQAATDNAHAVVSRAGNLANQAVDRGDNLMGKAGQLDIRVGIDNLQPYPIILIQQAFIVQV